MFYLLAIRLSYATTSFMGVNLNHLFLFRAVAEAGGFSRAAERIHVSQPAISMQVGELEAQLGLTLFHRLGRGVELTAARRLLLVYPRLLGALGGQGQRARAAGG